MEMLLSFAPQGGVNWLLGTFGLVLGVIFCYSSITAIYRLTLHPLAKYPGPFFCKLSDWPTLFSASSGNRHLQEWKAHQKYGPIVRIGPNTISINSVTGFKAIHGSRLSNVRKSDWYLTVEGAIGTPMTQTILDRQKHAFHRRVLDIALSETALKSVEHMIVENIQAWCTHLAEGISEPGDWSSPKNMAEWATYLSYDIMGDLTFGKKFHCMDSGEHRFVPPLILNATKMVYLIGLSPLAPFVRLFLGSPIMNVIGGQMARDNLRYNKYAASQMKQRITAETDDSKPSRKDLAHFLLNARDPQTGKGFTTEELCSESSLLIAAGSDTTSIAISAIMFHLSRNPEALDKLTSIIRSTFSSLDEIQAKTLNNLPYLRACLDESMRLSPVVPSHLPRQVLPGGLKIDKHNFSAGTIVNTPPYTINHNEEYYPDPFSYLPERWIVDPNVADGDISSESKVAIARSAFTTFGLGPRGCAGKRLAYLELNHALARLLFSYDLRVSQTSETLGASNPDHEHEGRRRPDEYQLEDYFLVTRYGPMLEFRARRE
ncbi:benzoate 4-monooxygenase cytochrome P450, variant 2 [Blastomyces dermatitidis ATCC 18188]|uniref:Benzoate 4-monooxygenase cytochrome P450 n=2 Tax=Ajellomyces dermatitidis (strain ATCC 18188 / CBS 674.68) TaxID=653446 RepID=F2TLG5_AJEDA|nr:benzoate 4-monooxygenase cytochrome P450 [Blastomyces dermatitidis ATCC 18188]KMW68278.1 benzoate 4-monooxygenase cytochrome P450, variant 1 [Blastomyces dermatitidis ATCC 18188]KMW68279.1 benzoate 4-monooxygenase cytochrome P450, variant 2 [Blastomyces dermatitidis ATCC 18188]